MTFPETFDEFAEQYKIVDSKEIYTNGGELIPIFRVKQWLEHLTNKNGARYIDANKIHQFVKENFKDNVPYEWAWTLTAIDKFPTADVVEVKHGRWIRHKENCLYNRCSICCYEHCRENNYCPNCGAKMDATPKERGEGEVNRKTKSNIEEAYKHIKPYIDDLECTEELREMCKYCERYCGKKHDYTHCEDMMCFKFYLSFVYLDWCNSSDGY